MSPTPDRTLDDLQQTIADLKRQLAESNAERDEAQAQQTATAEVLQVINSSPGDLAPVFEAMLDKAIRLCDAVQGALWLIEGERGRLAAAQGLAADFVELLRERGGSGGALQRVMRGERVIHYLDTKETEMPFVEAAVAADVRTLLWVALVREGTPLGAFAFARREVRAFSDKEIALVENFAAQAVIAMENARLITETREALDQQTATAEVLQVINSSPGDLVPVFDAILLQAHALCGAQHGALVIYQGEHFRAVATHGLSSRFGELYRQPFRTAPGSPQERLLRGEGLVHVPEFTTRPVDLIGGAAFDAGLRAVLMLPLRKEDTLLGYIVASRPEAGPFSDKQIALLENFAAQAVFAMENARLITETREALEQQTATAEVLQVINSSPGDLAPVFDAMLEKATRLCEAAFGLMSTYDGEHYHTVATHGVDPEYAEFLRAPPHPDPESGLGRIERGEDLVLFDDIADTEIYRNGDPRLRAIVDLGGAHSYVTVALRKDRKLLGIISAYRREVRPFSDKQIALLQNFAAQAVIAMENARLITETREALEQQTATAEVLGVINSSPGDLAPVFDAMLDKAIRLCEATHGHLFTYDGESFHLSAARSDARYIEWVREAGPVRPDPTTPLGRLTRGDRIVHVADIREDEGYRAVPIFRESVELRGVRSIITVALLKDNVLLGAMNVYRQEVRPFTDKQIALLQNFAAQAVIAMENARLITETREALEQQTATAEVLQVINSSPGDLAPVFDAMLEKAMALCGFAHGSLQTYDGQQFRAVAVRGLPEPLAALLRQGFRPGPKHPMQRLLEGDRFVQIADLTRVDSPGARTAVEAGSRTLLCIPLRKDDALLGQIVAVRREVRPFSDKEIALLENFAAQAVIAMENARLLTETREALDQQTATAEILQVINSSPGDLAPVFDAILEKAHSLCGADHGSLFLQDGEIFRAIASRGMPEGMTGPLREGIRANDSSLAQPLMAGEPFVHAHDSALDEHPNWIKRALDVVSSHRTLLSIPLRKSDTLLGMIVAGRFEVKPFTEKQIALLQNFAAQAVIAMENARLLNELRQRTEEVGELNRNLEARVAEQVDELGRVGRLKRFLAPQLAELIVSQGDEKILESHRREIVVVFCDLRGYTAFTETAEPEEVLDFLRQYHGALGPLVSQFEGTLDQFSGDGIMVFFNDPVPCPDPAERAVKMAVAMRSVANTLIVEWRERGRDLGFGAGIAQGYATLGQIGFSERSGYTAIGTVCNVAARLCAEAKDGQILLGQLVNVALKGSVATEQLGPLTLKGLSQPVVAYNIPLAASQPALRVIEGGSPETV